MKSDIQIANYLGSNGLIFSKELPFKHYRIITLQLLGAGKIKNTKLTYR